jgi:dihydrofolate reductase
MEGDLADEVRKRRTQQDVIVAGSDSVVQELMRQGLVDEFRLLIFPIVLGEGRRLFQDGLPLTPLRIVNVEQSGEAALVRLSK